MYSRLKTPGHTFLQPVRFFRPEVSNTVWTWGAPIFLFAIIIIIIIINIINIFIEGKVFVSR